MDNTNNLFKASEAHCANFFTRQEVCQHLGIGKNKFFELIRTGQLKARRQGRKIIVLPDDIAAYLQDLPEINTPHIEQSA